MFTGIIETLGKIQDIRSEGSNVHFTISSDITSELNIDQSISHNGVCLTVVGIEEENYIVTAISETLEKSNLGQLQVGHYINLERCTKIGSRLDGHIVQGHVDLTTRCTQIESMDGSWKFKFLLPESHGHLVIPQGSITINGTSLTISDLEEDSFSVAIIPYTYEHTVFQFLKMNDLVNIEFDMIGKYLFRFKRLGL